MRIVLSILGYAFIEFATISVAVILICYGFDFQFSWKLAIGTTAGYLLLKKLFGHIGKE